MSTFGELLHLEPKICLDHEHLFLALAALILSHHLYVYLVLHRRE